MDRGEKFLLIDVREESEYAKDHLPGAFASGQVGIVERRHRNACVPDTNAPLILYCGGGFRSALAADNLQKMGYTNVLSMDGGIRDWRNHEGVSVYREITKAGPLPYGGFQPAQMISLNRRWLVPPPLVASCLRASLLPLSLAFSEKSGNNRSAHLTGSISRPRFLLSKRYEDARGGLEKSVPSATARNI